MFMLVGSGGMARDYARVLDGLNCQYLVIGRGEDSALAFEANLGTPVIRGGLVKALKQGIPPDVHGAIVAVGVEGLFETTSQLIEAGIRHILVEKPAGLNAHEIHKLNQLAQSFGAMVYVAYNRRFYSSVRQAKKLIAEDGGIQSFNFEFTEWGHEIIGLQKAPGVKEQWVLGNSSHVLDLAFYLGGKPTQLYPIHSGGLEWHPTASIFVGCGRTDKEAVFSYQANWDAPGRWGIELCTRQRRFIFRPMEALQVMRKGSVAIETIAVEQSELDKQFKPGLFLQTKAFIEKQEGDLCSISEHCELLDNYVKIAGYSTKTGEA